MIVNISLHLSIIVDNIDHLCRFCWFYFIYIFIYFFFFFFFFWICFSFLFSAFIIPHDLSRIV